MRVPAPDCRVRLCKLAKKAFEAKTGRIYNIFESKGDAISGVQVILSTQSKNIEMMKKSRATSQSSTRMMNSCLPNGFQMFLLAQVNNSALIFPWCHYCHKALMAVVSW